MRQPSAQDRLREEQRSQSGVDASWESAKQAKRAVNVAWCAAAIGVVSALVNIVVPYVQQHIQDRAMVMQMHDVKTVIIPEIQKVIDQVISYDRQMQKYDSIARRDHPIGNNRLYDRGKQMGVIGYERPEPKNRQDAQLELSSLDSSSASLKDIRNDQERWIDRLPRDISIVKAVTTMQGTIKGIEEENEYRRNYLRRFLNLVPTGDLIEDRPPISPIWPPREFNNLLLLIDLNTKSDEVTDGPFQFGSCDDKAYRGKCYLLSREAIP